MAVWPLMCPHPLSVATEVLVAQIPADDHHSLTRQKTMQNKYAYLQWRTGEDAFPCFDGMYCFTNKPVGVG